MTPIELDSRIEALEQAALRDDEDALTQVLASLTRAPIASVLPRLLPGLEGPVLVAEASGRAALACLERAPRRRLWALDRALRVQRSHPLSPALVARRDTQLEQGRAGALALASMQRDGWGRARALQSLAADRPIGGLQLSLVIVRLNDPVPEIAALAQDSLRALPSGCLPAIVASLPLIAGAEQTVRASTSKALRALVQRLERAREHVLTALVHGAASADPDVRRHAIERLATLSPLDPRAAQSLRGGLDDPDPRVRSHCAQLVAHANLPAALVDPLLPQLERARSPHTRLLALRWHRRRGDEAALLRACFDANAGVRHYARRYHRALGRRVDYRELALVRLEQREPSDALVGALATLADLGHACDRPAIEALLEHPHARVVREARRTLELLGPAPQLPS